MIKAIVYIRRFKNQVGKFLKRSTVGRVCFVLLKRIGVARAIDGLDKTVIEGCIEEKHVYKEFFSTHKEQLNSVKELLEDDVSKKIFTSLVRYRLTRLKTDQPIYSELDQYFPADIITLKDNECFIDGGAYDGDTIFELKRLLRKQKLKEAALLPLNQIMTISKNYRNVIQALHAIRQGYGVKT